MAKHSSRLPLLLGTLIVVALAGAAGLFLLPHDPAPDPPAAPGPAEIEATPPTVQIEAFDGADRKRPEPSAQEQPALGALAGRVLDSDRRPVSGGRIELLQGEPLPLGGLSHLPRLGPRGEIDAEGRFVLGDVPAGDKIVVRALGVDFEPTESGPYLVRPGQTCDVGVIVVDPGLTLRGTISDERGRAIAGAQVALTRGAPLALGVDVAPADRVVLSDDRGSYLIAHATRGPFQLLVSAEGFGSTRIDRGVPLDPPRQLEINVQLRGAVTLSGVLLLPGGAGPAVHVEVLARGGEPGLADSLVRTDDRGRFLFQQLARGRRILCVDPEGFLPLTREVPAEEFEAGVTLELLPASILAGVITETDDTPLKAYDLQLRHSNKRGDIGDTVGATQRVRDGEGRFECADLVPGWYLLEVWARNHAVTLSKPVRVRAGGRTTLISVPMQPSSVLAGRVINDLDEPIAGAKISLHSNNSPSFGFLRASAARGSWQGSTRTDGEGRFRFPDATADTYQIEVDHPDYPLVQRNDVTILEGQQVELEAIVIERPAILKGLVIDGNGQLLKGVTVTLGGGHNRATRQVVSDGQGRYRFERLAPGDYQLDAFVPDAGPMGVLLSGIQRIQRGPEGKPQILSDVTLAPGEEREFTITARG